MKNVDNYCGKHLDYHPKSTDGHEQYKSNHSFHSIGSTLHVMELLAKRFYQHDSYELIWQLHIIRDY